MEKNLNEQLKDMEYALDAEKNMYTSITIARFAKKVIKVAQASSMFNLGVNTVKASLNKANPISAFAVFFVENAIYSMADSVADNILKDTSGGITESSLDKIWRRSAADHRDEATRLREEIKELRNLIDQDEINEEDDIFEDDHSDQQESVSAADVAADGAVQAALDAYEKNEHQEEADTVVPVEVEAAGA